MKKEVDNNMNKTEYENLKLADQQNGLIKKMKFL